MNMVIVDQYGNHEIISGNFLVPRRNETVHFYGRICIVKEVLYFIDDSMPVIKIPNINVFVTVE